MVNKYKKIVLVQGLEKMSDYQFRMVKSLLNKELKLTKKLQEEYDRISIADLMEDKFPNDAGLGKLINVCEDIPDIGNLPEILKKERTKVKNKNKQQLKAAKKRSKEEEPSISQPKSPTNKDVDPETAKNAPSLKKKGKKTIKAGMSTTMKLIKEKNQLLTPSASSTQQAESFPQTPHRPPPIAPSSSSIKKRGKKIIESEDFKRMILSQEQNQLSDPSAINTQQVKGWPETPHGPPATASCTSPAKKKKGSTTKTANIRSFLQQLANRLPETSGTSGELAESQPQSSHRPPPASPSHSSIKKSEGPRLATHSTSRIQVHDKGKCPAQLAATGPCRTVSSPQAPQGPPAATPNSHQTSQAHLKFSHGVWAQGPREMASSSTQVPPVPPEITSSSVQIRTPPQTSYVLTRTHPGTPAGAFILFQPPQMCPAMSSSSLQTPPVLLRPSGNVQDVQVAPLSGLCSPQGFLASTSKTHLDPQEPPSSTCSGFPDPWKSPATTSQRKRLTNTPKEPSREDDYQTGLKEVTVLKATEPFTYEMKEGKKMFHATVATENEFFKVKVFDVSLKEKFIPDNVIAISHYYGCDGFLEIYHDSCVYEIKSNSKMDIKPMLKRNASATPKIDYLYSQQRGIFVDGVFLVHKKQVRNECIYYTVGDKTGMMEVVVYGRLTNIDCEAGDKLRLFCFELDSTADSCQLRSVMHSHMKVIKART
uniref:interferon-activable protein 203-like n=1 Tax=Jaculus jaculus TaxID=51337 RepID=UPI001E1B49F5|nr:interferon-activable protein 203-like [Jaculus jaculus]XP_044998413.1 interferon-activable protein 203-like [Jaculus jaculus]